MNTGKAVGWSHVKHVLGLMSQGRFAEGLAALKRVPLTTYGVPGQSDLQGIIDGGRFLAIEVKRPGEKQTEDQIAWGSMVNKRGGLYIVATSVDDAINQLRLHGVVRAV